jgi:signal transduction histidine kinase
MKIKIIHKYFLIAFACMVSFLVIGFLINGVIGRVLMSTHSQPQMVPPIFVAKILDHIGSIDKVQAAKDLADWSEGFPLPQIVLLNEDGKVLFPDSYVLPFDWSHIKKPEKPYDYVEISEEESSPMGNGFGMMPPAHPGGGPPPPNHLMWDHGPMPPPPLMTPFLVRLKNPTPLFLYITRPKMLEAPGFGNEQNTFLRFMPLLGLISLVISLLLGVGTALALINSSVKRQVKLADGVISQLQHGNLKARFPILRKDEFGQAMKRFNVMADEIEKLVEHLHSVEQARTKLLQELAHDLRTPMASLKNLLETLNLKGKQVNPEIQKEFLELSLKEVEYFERLVEDLLFMAQVNEPKYQSQTESLIIIDILDEEAEDCVFRLKEQIDGKTIDLVKQFEVQKISISGDAHLIRRLFRNALENAFSFAHSKVKLSAEMDHNKKYVIIRIEDDGPGFTKENLQSFAERKMSRKLTQGKGKRLSVGLGSVIMKAICSIHRGELHASNDLGPDGKTRGASIEIKLPA